MFFVCSFLRLTSTFVNYIDNNNLTDMCSIKATALPDSNDTYKSYITKVFKVLLNFSLRLHY